MQKQSGVITIYLALTLGLILAMVVTTIEIARVNAAKTLFHRVIQTSMESAMCDYYLPLYERYHIFGLHLEGKTNEQQQVGLKEKLTARALDSLNPTSNLSVLPYLVNGSDQTFLMCNPNLEDINLDNMVYLTDQEGRVMRDQAIAYTKYAAPLDLLEKLLESIGVMKEANVAGGMISEKMSLERDLAAIDQKTLQLIELIEGVETEEYGFKQSTFLKELSVTDHFVKQIVREAPTQSNLNINHSTIYDTVEDSYMRISEEIEQMREGGIQIYEFAQSAFKVDSDNQSEYVFEDEDQKEDFDAMFFTYEALTNIAWYVFKEINNKISEALILIEQIEQEKRAAADNYTNYKADLETKKEELGEVLYRDLYNELLSNDEDILAYTDATSNQVGLIRDIQQMKQTLLHNQGVLTGILNSVHVPFSIDPQEYEAWKQSLVTLENQLNSYSLQGLSFDYSKVEFQELNFGVFSLIGGMICSGIFNSVIDPSIELSKGKLSNVSLPSHYQQDSAAEQDIEEIEDLSKKYLEIGNLDFANMGITTEGNNAAVDIGESLLFLAYISEHSTSFSSEQYKVGQVLKYEQEYLLLGHLKDKENLEEFTTRLVMIRTLFNMISVLTDPAKVSKAASTASLMAVTCLPFLVSVAKYLILFYWAYSEARVETAALLKGKSVPIYTTQGEFIVSYTDLLGMTTNKVISLAQKYEAKSLLKLNYSDYLLINLYFVGEQEKTYRMMDLIQENLRYEYEDNFRMKNCLYSFSCRADSVMKQKFLFLPYFQKENITINGYRLHSKAAVTY
jgi:hypothetical protein